MICPIDNQKCVPKDCCFGDETKCSELRYCRAITRKRAKGRKRK